MSEEIIKEIYAAFGRGDIDSILAKVTPDTRWDFNVGKSNVPWHAPVTGKSELPGFFRAMSEQLDFRSFEPRAILHSGREVVARLRVEYQMKRTGKKVAEEQVHWWTLDAEGKVSALRHFEDTAQVQEAWGGQ